MNASRAEKSYSQDKSAEMLKGNLIITIDAETQAFLDKAGAKIEGTKFVVRDKSGKKITHYELAGQWPGYNQARISAEQLTMPGHFGATVVYTKPGEEEKKYHFAWQIPYEGL